MEFSEGGGTAGESTPLGGALCFERAASLEDFGLGPLRFSFLFTPAFPPGWPLSWGLADTWAFGTEGTVDSELGPLEVPFILWKGFLERCCFPSCCLAFGAPLALLAG